LPLPFPCVVGGVVEGLFSFPTERTSPLWVLPPETSPFFPSAAVVQVSIFLFQLNHPFFLSSDSSLPLSLMYGRGPLCSVGTSALPFRGCRGSLSCKVMSSLFSPEVLSSHPKCPPASPPFSFLKAKRICFCIGELVSTKLLSPRGTPPLRPSPPGPFF